jgi:hypothetical protein
MFWNERCRWFPVGKYFCFVYTNVLIFATKIFNEILAHPTQKKTLLQRKLTYFVLYYIPLFH